MDRIRIRIHNTVFWQVRFYSNTVFVDQEGGERGQHRGPHSGSGSGHGHCPQGM
jgi:hypothetical protein